MGYLWPNNHVKLVAKKEKHLVQWFINLDGLPLVDSSLLKIDSHLCHSSVKLIDKLKG